MEKKGKKFNPKDWQGRSKQQVESNYKVMAYGCVVLLAVLIIGGLINVLTNVLG